MTTQFFCHNHWFSNFSTSQRANEYACNEKTSKRFHTKSNSPELKNLEQKRDCTLSNTLQFETAKTRAKCSTAFYWRGKGEVRNQTTAQVGLSNMKRLGMLLLFLGQNTSSSQIILSICPGFRQSAHIIYI